MNDLVIIENLNAVEVFSGSGIDDILKKITDESRAVVPDVKTAKGRADIASIAHKVAKSKTALDAMGKDLVSEWKTKSKAVDAERKKARDYLDDLKAEVRQPLTEWEDAEKRRIQDHESRISAITEYGLVVWSDKTYEELQKLSDLIEAVNIESFEEYATDAAKAKDTAITQIREAIAKREAYDKEQDELGKLRAESEARAKADEEERLRKEGEERARLLAEKDAKEEAERVRREAEKAEEEKQEAIDAQKAAELRAKQAEDNAKIEAEKAAQAERDRIEQERIDEELAAKKRESDKKHKAKINNAAAKSMVDSLMAYDSGEKPVTLKQAKLIVTAIAQGKVPHTRISY